MYISIQLPNHPKFELIRSIELANLIERAYQQLDYYLSQKGQEGIPNWEEKLENQLIGSTKIDLVSRPKGIRELDDPQNPGRTEYAILATFSYTGFWIGVPDDVPFGFIARRTLEDGTPGIFVIFRGTRNEPEWFTNMQYAQVPFLSGDNTVTANSTWGQVSRGFNKIYTRPDPDERETISALFKKPQGNIGSLRQAIIQTLNDKTLCPDNAQVFVTGHSLGGALATLATLDIYKHTQFDTDPILYTFASPRVGDPTFASNFADIASFRIANSEDIVPNLPPPSSRVVGSEMTGEMTDARRGTGQFLLKTTRRVLDVVLNTEYVYEHVGMPLYFTTQKGSVSYNHNMSETYREALIKVG